MTRNVLGGILKSMSAIGLVIVAYPAAASADSLSDLTQVCAGCHGEKGIPTEKTTPIIWGQNRAYLLDQLHDFKVGHRKNELMSAVVESLSKTDMEALATHFAEQKWPDLQQPPPSAEAQVAARAIVDSVNCRACHHEHYQGDTVRPRLAGQQAEYLLKTMTDFHDGKRTNYIGMAVLMKSVHETALKPVADYLASRQIAGPPSGAK